MSRLRTKIGDLEDANQLLQAHIRNLEVMSEDFINLNNIQKELSVHFYDFVELVMRNADEMRLKYPDIER